MTACPHPPGLYTNVWDGQCQLHLPPAMVMPLSKAPEHRRFTKIASQGQSSTFFLSVSFLYIIKH